MNLDEIYSIKLRFYFRLLKKIKIIMFWLTKQTNVMK